MMICAVKCVGPLPGWECASARGLWMYSLYIVSSVCITGECPRDNQPYHSHMADMINHEHGF